MVNTLPSDKYSTHQSTNPILLFRCKTLFPFTLFPDEITIDSEKISIIRDNILTRHIDTIAISDILKASVFHGPFLGSLEITTRFFSQKPIAFTHLKKADAIKSRSLIQGLIIVRQKKHDIKSMSKEQICKLCFKLGKAL